MKQLAVDIGGTFTDCFVAWDDRLVEAKALTTKHNLALGFNEAVENAAAQLGVTPPALLAEADSVRYATTLGTNALIERSGPQVGLLVTAGFDSIVPLSRGLGYGVGLPYEQQVDIPNADRPEPIVPISLIRTVRERVDYKGEILCPLDEDHLRLQLRELADEGAEALVVALTNSVVNPVHELAVLDIVLEEYPADMLGAIPVLLSHQVAGRKGEFGRTMSSIISAYLHRTMYHALSALETNLRHSAYRHPMLIVHNSGGMARLNSTHALQTVHSGPVSGIYAASNLARQAELGGVIATDMGGTSFDIGVLADGAVHHYDFNPVIDRWMVNHPMVHLSTLGAGGGSIASYDRVFGTIKVGPESAGSSPGPACYDRGGTRPTVTDADLLLGYLDPAYYAAGTIPLKPNRSRMVVEAELCDDLGLVPVAVAKLIKEAVDADMANGIATELRVFGYEPTQFTMLAYGGNGPLHACGIARHLGVRRILAPPYASSFSACGAANLDQLHIHEMSTYTVLFHTMLRSLYEDYEGFNAIVAELERRGFDDLTRQGVDPARIHHALELDMRYGNQRVQTTVATDLRRIGSPSDVLHILEQFHQSYGARYGEGSQAPEAGVRINTVRVKSFVELPKVNFSDVMPPAERLDPPDPAARRPVHFIGRDGAVETPVYHDEALVPGTVIPGPAVITTRSTTYLVEPGWRLEAAPSGAAWFFAD